MSASPSFNSSLSFFLHKLFTNVKHLIFLLCLVNAVDLHLPHWLEFPTADMMASPSARQVLIEIIANLLKQIGLFWNEFVVGVGIYDDHNKKKNCVKTGTKGDKLSKRGPAVLSFYAHLIIVYSLSRRTMVPLGGLSMSVPDENMFEFPDLLIENVTGTKSEEGVEEFLPLRFLP